MSNCDINKQKQIINKLTMLVPKNEKTLLEIARSVHPGNYTLKELLNDFQGSVYLNTLQKFYKHANVDMSTKNIVAESQQPKTSTEERYMSNIATNFTSPVLDDLFDSMPLAKKYFEQNMNERLMRAILVGKVVNDKYVNTKTEINQNIIEFKDELFLSIVNFLKTKGIIIEGNIKLYDRKGKFNNYEKYTEVLQKLEKWFKENRTTLITATQRDIPSLSVNLGSATDRQILDIYNAGIMLSNFDNVIFKKFSNIIKLDFSTFNQFDGPLKGYKYELANRGLETTYWLNDDHQSEAAETLLDDYTKSIIGLVKVLDKNKDFTGEYLEAKDFYSLASFLNAFELENFNEFNKDPKWKSLNESPVEAFKLHLERILNNYDNQFKDTILEGDIINSSNYSVFKSSINKIRSISIFLKNIENKEASSTTQPISSVFTQVINNSFGANYLVNNSNIQDTEIKEMHSHNANRVKLYNDLYAFLKANVKNTKKFYFGKSSEDKPNNTAEREYILDLVTNPDVTPLKFFIHKVTGKILTDDGLDRLKLIKATLSKNGELNYGSLVDDLHSYLVAVRSSLDTEGTSVLEKIINNENNILANEYSLVESNASIISDASKSLQAIFDIYLEDFVLKPISTISTLSGEKIPVWKTSNMMYNDIENLLTRSRTEKRKEHDDNAYKNIFVNYGGLKGTSTKLEVINAGSNKAASAYNVAEHFISSFQYEFLNSFDNKKKNDLDGKIHVMIGNYADKSTILAKMIDRHLKISINGKDKHIIGNSNGEDIATQEELQELTRKQSNKYYSGLLQTIFDKYTTIFNSNPDLKIKLIDGDIDNNIVKINSFLNSFKNQDELLIYLQNINVDITEELDYSTYLSPVANIEGKYDKVLGLNQTVIDYYRIYSNEENFKEFVNFQENNFSEKLELLKGENVLIGGGNFDKILDNYEGYLNSFGISKKEMNKFLITEHENGTNTIIGLKIVDDDNNLNPLAKRWLWSNALLRNEYLYITVKPEYMHPHKMALTFRGNVLSVNYNQFELESSGRLIMQAKRNVSFTGTIERPKRKDRLGTLDNVNVAVIKDLTAPLYNLSGDTTNQDIHDGSSKINYLYSKMVDNSYPGKNYEGTKKQLGTFSNEYGSALKKDAETVIDNKSMIGSNNSAIKLKKLHMKMLSSHTISFPQLSTNLSTNNIFLRNGEYTKINKIELNGNTVTLNTSSVDPITKKTVRNSEPEIHTDVFNLYTLWQILGGEYSVDENLNFSEGSNELLFNLITHKSLKLEDVQKLKSSMIHITSTASSFKSGAVNLNTSDVYTNTNKLRFATFENRHMGPQLDAKHHADASKVKEITQLISALSQNSSTASIAEEIYNDLARIIEVSASKYLENIKDLTPDKRQAFYKQLSQQFARALTTSNETNLASIIASTFKFDDIIPISNQNFFTQFVKTMVTKMNNEFITRYYTGLGVILNPSHSIIQVFEDSNGNVYQQEDILKKALKAYQNNPRLEESDNIIFGHPGIGKTYAFDNGIDIIDFDTVYKPALNDLIAKTLGIKTKDLTKDLRNNFKENDPRYIEFLDAAWEKAKQDAKLQNKKLYASDMLTLEKHSQDFDKFINIDKDTFIQRAKQRNDYNDFTNEWKDRIDNLLSVVDQSKIIETSGYLVDLINLNNKKIVDNYIRENFKDISTTWDKIKLGDTILIDGLPRVLETPEIYYELKGDKLSEAVIKVMNVPRDLKPSEMDFEVLEKQNIINPELSKEAYTKKASLIDKLDKIVNMKEDATLGEALAELNNLSHSLRVIKHNLGEEYETLLSNLYKEFPDDMLVSLGDIISFEAERFQEELVSGRPTISPVSKNLFDLDSIRLRYMYEMAEDKVTLKDSLILSNFKNFLALSFGVDINNKKAISTYLNAWTNRNLQLMDSKFILPTVDENTDFNDYFGEDDLLRTNFNDVKDFYIQKSIPISNYKFHPAEIIMPNIHKTAFDTENSTISEIRELKSTYFKNKLENTLFTKEDNRRVDFKITSGYKNVYIKFVSALPQNKEDNNIYDKEYDEKTDTFIDYRLSNTGERLYIKPPNSKILVDKSGNDTIYIKVANKKTVKNGDKYVIIEETDDILKERTKKSIKNLIKSFKGEITSIIPLMNNTDLNLVKTIEKDGVKTFVNSSLNYLSYNTFINFTSYKGKPAHLEELDKNWLDKNKEAILNQLSTKKYASWEKHHQVVTARIPAQSMQSFMEMNNVGYLKTDNNDAYVSIWQIWLQGSDFDIDKAYSMAYGFNKDGQYDTWSPLSGYSNVEQLEALENLPVPTGIVANLSETGINLTSNFEQFLEYVKVSGLTTIDDITFDMPVHILDVFAKSLRAINKNSNGKEADIFIGVNELSGLGDTINDTKNLFIDLLNLHNSDESYKTKGNAIKNSVVFKIRKIISSPSNQLLANSPVDIRPLHKGAADALALKLSKIEENFELTMSEGGFNKFTNDQIKSYLEFLTNEKLITKDEKRLKGLKGNNLANKVKEILLERSRRKVLVSSVDMLSMFKQQEDASIGKADVGIGANGLKVFFALSSYYNNWYESLNNSDELLHTTDFFTDNKVFMKKFTVNGKTRLIHSLANVGINKKQFNTILDTYGYSDIEREWSKLSTNQAAISMSAFVSGATDNAKELVMAKINAVVELAGMHLYMMSLGYNESEVSIFMNSKLGLYITKNLKSNMYNNSEEIYISDLINSYKDSLLNFEDSAERTIELLELETFSDIYNGAQEFKILASILGVNQKTSANVVELNKFLSKLETTMFMQEHKMFKHDLYLLRDSETWDKEKESLHLADSTVLLSPIQKIIQENSLLKLKYSKSEESANEVIQYVKDTLTNAMNINVNYLDENGNIKSKKVDIVGGKFDFRYYMFSSNDKYRKATADYYNLFKNTVNVFDAIDKLPHFKAMIDGVNIIHETLSVISKKYNFAFNHSRDVIKKYERELVDNNKTIKNKFGNKNFGIKQDEKVLGKLFTHYDKQVIFSWLTNLNIKKKDDLTVSPKDIKINITELLRQHNSIQNITPIDSITVDISNTGKINTRNDYKVDKKLLNANVKVISPNDTDEFILELDSDYNIANFKMIMEELIFPILASSKNSLLGSKYLNLGSVRNLYGQFTTQILSTYQISSLNTPESLQKFSELVTNFNEIDSVIENELKIKNINNKVVGYQDLMYLYNLIVNNESYGDKRLTPLFEGYIKKPNTLGKDYLNYSTLVDTGKVNVLAPWEDVERIQGLNEEEARELRNSLKIGQELSMIHSAFNTGGSLNFGKVNGRLVSVSLKNSNYVINTDMDLTDSTSSVKYNIFKAILSNINTKNLIINFRCD